MFYKRNKHSLIGEVIAETRFNVALTGSLKSV